MEANLRRKLLLLWALARRFACTCVASGFAGKSSSRRCRCGDSIELASKARKSLESTHEDLRRMSGDAKDRGRESFTLAARIRPLNRRLDRRSKGAEVDNLADNGGGYC